MPGCWVVLSVVVVSIMVGASVEVLVGMAIVGVEEGVEGTVIVVCLSEAVATVVDVVVGVGVGVVAGGLVVVVVIAIVSFPPCLFSSTNSTNSSTTLKADTVVMHSKNAAIKGRRRRLFIRKRFQ